MALAAPHAAAQTVGPGVSETLAAVGTVRVVVALGEAPAAVRTASALAAQQAAVAAVQGRVLRALPADAADVSTRFASVPALVLRLRSGAALAALAAHPDVVRIDLDAGGGGGLAQTVALVQGTAWHDRSVTGQGVTVAVLDTGLDSDHPDLAGAAVDQSCFVDRDGLVNGRGLCPNGSDRQTGPGAAEDDHGHGTHVSSIALGRGATGSVGMAPGARLVSVKVLDRANSFAYFSEIVAGLDYLVSNPQLGVRVVNLSLGTTQLFPTVCDGAASWTRAGAQAVRLLRDQGVVLFASAMNEGSGTSVAAPACLSGVTAVGASSLSDQIASFSNSNALVDLVAPGVSVTASRRGGGLTTMSGTSMASPHVAGCAALLLAGGAASTPDGVLAAIRTASTTSITDPKNGQSFPRLDCFDASFVTADDALGAPVDGLALALPSPNPSRATAHLTLRTGSSQTVRVVVLDALGRTVAVVHDGPLAAGAALPLAVDVRALPAGLYAVRATSETAAAARRLVVVR